MPRILIDLTHNENFDHISNDIFEIDYLFDFLNPGDPFPRFSELNQYDLLIFGEIIPSKNQKDHLFQENEIISIRRYINNGGKLLLTSSSGGDFDYKRSQGSIRALSPVTGVKRYWWGELFNSNKGSFFGENENLVINDFPSHPIFDGVKELVLADCTFLEPVDSSNTEQILFTPANTQFRYFIDEDEDNIGKVPIIVSNGEKNGNGMSLTIGSTLFMTKNKKYGTDIADNALFFRNIIKWLLGD